MDTSSVQDESELVFGSDSRSVSGQLRKIKIADIEVGSILADTILTTNLTVINEINGVPAAATVSLNAIQVLQNKTLIDTNTFFAKDSERSNRLQFQLLNTVGSLIRLQIGGSTNATIVFPTESTTLMGTSVTENVTGIKTFVNPITTNSINFSEGANLNCENHSVPLNYIIPNRGSSANLITSVGSHTINGQLILRNLSIVPLVVNNEINLFNNSAMNSEGGFRYNPATGLQFRNAIDWQNIISPTAGNGITVTGSTISLNNAGWFVGGDDAVYTHVTNESGYTAYDRLFSDPNIAPNISHELFAAGTTLTTNLLDNSVAQTTLLATGDSTFYGFDGTHNYYDTVQTGARHNFGTSLGVHPSTTTSFIVEQQIFEDIAITSRVNNNTQSWNLSDIGGDDCIIRNIVNSRDVYEYNSQNQTTTILGNHTFSNNNFRVGSNATNVQITQNAIRWLANATTNTISFAQNSINIMSNAVFTPTICTINNINFNTDGTVQLPISVGSGNANGSIRYNANTFSGNVNGTWQPFDFRSEPSLRVPQDHTTIPLATAATTATLIYLNENQIFTSDFTFPVGGNYIIKGLPNITVTLNNCQWIIPATTIVNCKNINFIATRTLSTVGNWTHFDIRGTFSATECVFTQTLNVTFILGLTNPAISLFAVSLVGIAEIDACSIIQNCNSIVQLILITTRANCSLAILNQINLTDNPTFNLRQSYLTVNGVYTAGGYTLMRAIGINQSNVNVLIGNNQITVNWNWSAATLLSLLQVTFVLWQNTGLTMTAPRLHLVSFKDNIINYDFTGSLTVANTAASAILISALVSLGSFNFIDNTLSANSNVNRALTLSNDFSISSFNYNVFANIYRVTGSALLPLIAILDVPATIFTGRMQGAISTTSPDSFVDANGGIRVGTGTATATHGKITAPATSILGRVGSIDRHLTYSGPWNHYVKIGNSANGEPWNVGLTYNAAYGTTGVTTGATIWVIDLHGAVATINALDFAPAANSVITNTSVARHRLTTTHTISHTGNPSSMIYSGMGITASFAVDIGQRFVHLVSATVAGENSLIFDDCDIIVTYTVGTAIYTYSATTNNAAFGQVISFTNSNTLIKMINCRVTINVINLGTLSHLNLPGAPVALFNFAQNGGSHNLEIMNSRFSINLGPNYIAGGFQLVRTNTTPVGIGNVDVRISNCTFLYTANFTGNTNLVVPGAFNLVQQRGGTYTNQQHTIILNNNTIIAAITGNVSAEIRLIDFGNTNANTNCNITGNVIRLTSVPLNTSFDYVIATTINHALFIDDNNLSFDSGVAGRPSTIKTINSIVAIDDQGGIIAGIGNILTTHGKITAPTNAILGSVNGTQRALTYTGPWNNYIKLGAESWNVANNYNGAFSPTGVNNSSVGPWTIDLHANMSLISSMVFNPLINSFITHCSISNSMLTVLDTQSIQFLTACTVVFQKINITCGIRTTGANANFFALLVQGGSGANNLTFEDCTLNLNYNINANSYATTNSCAFAQIGGFSDASLRISNSRVNINVTRTGATQHPAAEGYAVSLCAIAQGGGNRFVEILNSRINVTIPIGYIAGGFQLVRNDTTGNNTSNLIVRIVNNQINYLANFDGNVNAIIPNAFNLIQQRGGTYASNLRHQYSINDNTVNIEITPNLGLRPGSVNLIDFNNTNANTTANIHNNNIRLITGSVGCVFNYFANRNANTGIWIDTNALTIQTNWTHPLNIVRMVNSVEIADTDGGLVVGVANAGVAGKLRFQSQELQVFSNSTWNTLSTSPAIIQPPRILRVGDSSTGAQFTTIASAIATLSDNQNAILQILSNITEDLSLAARSGCSLIVVTDNNAVTFGTVTKGDNILIFRDCLTLTIANMSAIDTARPLQFSDCILTFTNMFTLTCPLVITNCTIISNTNDAMFTLGSGPVQITGNRIFLQGALDGNFRISLGRLFTSTTCRITDNYINYNVTISSTVYNPSVIANNSANSSNVFITGNTLELNNVVANRSFNYRAFHDLTANFGGHCTVAHNTFRLASTTTTNNTLIYQTTNSFTIFGNTNSLLGTTIDNSAIVTQRLPNTLNVINSNSTRYAGHQIDHDGTTFQSRYFNYNGTQQWSILNGVQNNGDYNMLSQLDNAGAATVLSYSRGTAITTIPSLTVTGATTASGAITASNNLTVSGTTSLQGTTTTSLTASGAITANNNLTVSGTTSLQSTTTTSLTASGAITASNNLTVSGTTTTAAITSSGNITMNNAASVLQTENVRCNDTLRGSWLYLGGNKNSLNNFEAPSIAYTAFSTASLLSVNSSTSAVLVPNNSGRDFMRSIQTRITSITCTVAYNFNSATNLYVQNAPAQWDGQNASFYLFNNNTGTPIPAGAVWRVIVFYVQS